MTIFTTPVFAQQYWGSLAFDKNTGIAGGAVDARDEANAENTAMKSCARKHGNRKSNCKVQVSFYNGCAAMYWSFPDQKGGWGTSDYDENQAVARAYKTCKEQGGSKCQNRLSFCTTRIFY